MCFHSNNRPLFSLLFPVALLPQVLKFNLTESGLFCVLPWLTMAFSANVGGWIADTLVSKGYSVTTVRKVLVDSSLCVCVSVCLCVFYFIFSFFFFFFSKK